MRPFELRTQKAQRFLDDAARNPAVTLVVLDFDGTLAPIVDDPQDSRMLPAAAEALAALGPRIGHLAIVTGRPVATVRELGRLDQRPGLERLIVLGHYGAESWDAATGVEVPQSIPASIVAARREVEDLLEAKGLAGVHIEDKGSAIGVHTRRAQNPEAAFTALEAPLGALAQRLGLVLEPGRNVLELRSSAVTKGDALRSLVARTGAQVVAMCGDDLGDLPAFDALDELAAGGLTTCAVVSASDEQTALLERADVIADGPPGIAAWLQSLAGLCG